MSKGVYDPNLSMRNKASIKTVEARDIRVISQDPVFTLEGRIECRSGAAVSAAQVVLGKVALNAGRVVTLAPYATSQKQTFSGDNRYENVKLTATLPVSKVNTIAAVDLTFNPPRHYEQLLKNYVAKGGSAAGYLQQTQIVEQPVDVNLVGWCVVKQSTNALKAGDEYGGVRAFVVRVNTLYEGDLKIVGGAGPSSSMGSIQAPGEDKPKRVDDKEKPARAQ